MISWIGASILVQTFEKVTFLVNICYSTMVVGTREVFLEV